MYLLSSKTLSSSLSKTIQSIGSKPLAQLSCSYDPNFTISPMLIEDVRTVFPFTP